MTKRAVAALVLERLLPLYPGLRSALHWENPWELLVATVLAAQCTDARVNRITPHLWAVADTAGAMMQVPVGRIEEIIRPCGLAPQKARAIAGLSRLLVERHGGRVPRSFAELEALRILAHVGYQADQ